MMKITKTMTNMTKMNACEGDVHSVAGTYWKLIQSFMCVGALVRGCAGACVRS